MNRRDFLRNTGVAGLALVLPVDVTTTIHKTTAVGATEAGLARGTTIAEIWSPKLVEQFYKSTTFDHLLGENDYESDLVQGEIGRFEGIKILT